jgi:hypothetical protein
VSENTSNSEAELSARAAPRLFKKLDESVIEEEYARSAN